VRRLLYVAAAVWIGRWLALEAASWLGRRRPPGPAPVDSPRVPGRMPRRHEPIDNGPNG
jgi:hypothetical protein